MKAHIDLRSRRNFLLKLGYGATLAAVASYAPSIFAETAAKFLIRQSTEMLPLHFNENSLGMSVKAMNAAKQALIQFGNRYAVEHYNGFVSELAAHHKVSEQQLILGNGSTEILSAVVTYAATQNAVVIEPTPTFGALKGYSENHGMKVIGVPVDDEFIIDIAAMKAIALKQNTPVLINLCNPNNPTGNIVKHQALVNWISNAPDNHIFLIDEAYYDYAVGIDDYQSMLSMIQAGNDKVVVSRTFSKIYGMAGMRMGYGLATEKMAALIKPFAAGFNINVAGIAAASASLTDTEYYARSLASNAHSKKILTAALDELSLDYVPSHTNFILHRLGKPLESYTSKMLENNIKVGRKMTESPYWNRISLGTPDQTQQFVETLRAFRERDWV
ncbi:histidinol-phosphate transaminase [Glaciecola sp. SC05]|uniref:pyridoxal phosphate-dependent aminotransferase n=1 Tax=Glaciecola sp. SC05 TaxID=1987355 RepID=UPI003528650A